MNYSDAMNRIIAGQILFSQSLGGAVCRMPGSGLIVFVPRIKNEGPVLKIGPLVVDMEFSKISDWVLAGVDLRQPKE